MQADDANENAGNLYRPDFGKKKKQAVIEALHRPSHPDAVAAPIGLEGLVVAGSAVRHEIAGEEPPIDCRMKWGGRAVVISDTTAVLLLGAMRELQRQGGVKAKDAEGARVLMQAFDECALIARDVVASLEDGS